MSNVLNFVEKNNEIQIEGKKGSYYPIIGHLRKNLDGFYQFCIHGYSPIISEEEMKEIADKLSELNSEVKKGVWFKTFNEKNISVLRDKNVIGTLILNENGSYKFFVTNNGGGLSATELMTISTKLTNLNIPF